MKRAVLYLSGFDPRGEKFYRRTFRNELRKFSKINSLDCQIDSKQNGKFSAKTNQTETDLFFLSWQNIIDNIYHKSRIIALLATFIGSLVFFTNIRSVKNTNKIKIFFASIVMVDFCVILLGIVGCIIAINYLVYLTSMIIVFVILSLIASYFYAKKKFINKRIRVWIQGFISLAFFYTNSKTKEFSKQAKIHKNVIEELIKKNNYDEIVLYVHSAGAIPLLFLLDKLSEESLKQVKIISVGQCISSYINTRHFYQLKKRLVYLLERDYLEWYDLYSPVDGVSAKLDSDNDLKSLGLYSVNAQFYKMYSEEKYDEVKSNHLLLHFHYILCGDNPVSPFNFYYLLTHNKPIKGYKKI